MEASKPPRRTGGASSPSAPTRRELLGGAAALALGWTAAQRVARGAEPPQGQTAASEPGAAPATAKGAASEPSAPSAPIDRPDAGSAPSNHGPAARTSRVLAGGESFGLTLDDVVAAELARAPLAEVFDGSTPTEARVWQERFGARLRALLGPHAPPAAGRVQLERRVELADHVREELLLVAPTLGAVPVHRLVPRGLAPTERVPGLLALHGHGDLAHDLLAGNEDVPGVVEAVAARHGDVARQLVRRGYVVIAPCLLPFGRRRGSRSTEPGGDGAARGRWIDACADAELRLALVGKLLLAENLRDALWAFEVLAADERVDAERLGAVGLSLGGRMATFVAALEPRVRVVAVSGALHLYATRAQHPWQCGAQTLPRLLEFGDLPEVAGLVAPRPLLFEVGAADPGYDASAGEEAVRRIRRVCAALGHPDAVGVAQHAGGHRWHGTAAYELLAGVLRPAAA